jgi:hypothetical protein
MFPRLLAAVFGLTALTACPEGVDFFVNTNGDVVQRVQSGGGGVIIGVGGLEAEDAASSSLVSGQIPPGLTLQPDGTVSGIPEEPGFFEFTVETVDTEGLATLETMRIEVE